MGETSRQRRSRSAAAAILIGTLALGGCILTPHPLTDAERWAEARADRTAMFAGQEPLNHPLTLHEAFARALKYNLDARVKVMEVALAQDDLDLSRWDLLPRAAYNAAYLTRDNVDAASSRSIITGQQSLEPSTSTDKNRVIADLTLSWNVLDFGVSYFTARQQADRLLVAEEQRRRVVQVLLQDVRRAYWRAASAQALSARIRTAIRDAEAALPAARKVETEGLRSPVDALRYQKALLDLLRQLEGVQELLAVSKTELASLINLPPSQNYSLAVPRMLQLQIRAMPVREMEETALLLNPDIREQSYHKRISVDETRKSILRLLPGITFTYSPNYDSNSFLTNHHWVAGAARLGGYLNTLLTAPVTIARAENNELLVDTRREAVSMAVLAKLNIAYQQYLAATREYRRSADLAEVDQRLYQQIANRAITDAQGDLERISAQVSAVFSELRRYQSYADAQAALGRLYATLGLDPVAGEVETLDIAALSRAIRRAMADWQRGRVPPPPPGGPMEQSGLAPATSVAAVPQDERIAVEPPGTVAAPLISALGLGGAAPSGTSPAPAGPGAGTAVAQRPAGRSDAPPLVLAPSPGAVRTADAAAEHSPEVARQ
jgi:outer membrane protein, multidrug efflux system